MYHPAYAGLLADDAERACFFTDHDARRWVDKALSYAAEQRLSVVFDSTLSRPATAETITSRFRAAGYRFQIAFVAAPAALSRLGVISRYVEAVAARGHGRFSLNHDETYDGVLEVADLVDRAALVDRLDVYRRGGQHLAGYELPRADPRGDTGARAAIEAERRRPWTTQEATAYLEAVEDVTRKATALIEQGGMEPSWYPRIAQAALTAEPLIPDATIRTQLVSRCSEIEAQGGSKRPAAKQTPRAQTRGPAAGRDAGRSAAPAPPAAGRRQPPGAGRGR